MTSSARFSALIIICIALAGLRLRYDAVYTGLGQYSALQTLWVMSAHYTILANLALVGLLIGVVQKRMAGRRAWGAVIFSMMAVALIYRLMLSPDLDLGKNALWSDIALHIIAPILSLGWWASFAPKRLDWNDLPYLTIWPLSFLIYSVLRGFITGYWPYDFLNIPETGWLNALLQLIGVSFGVGFAAAALIWLSRLLCARDRQSN